MGKALCFVTLLCLETIRQLLSSDVVKCYHMGYLSHSTLPLPYPVTVLMGLLAQTTLHGLRRFARMHWILGTSLEVSHACNGLQ